MWNSGKIVYQSTLQHEFHHVVHTQVLLFESSCQRLLGLKTSCWTTRQSKNNENEKRYSKIFFKFWSYLSIIVDRRAVSDCSRLCLSFDSGIVSARFRAPFTSATRQLWASGAWLHDASDATKVRTSAGLSLSPAVWHEGNRLSSKKANAEVSSLTNSLVLAGKICSATKRAHPA